MSQKGREPQVPARFYIAIAVATAICTATASATPRLEARGRFLWDAPVPEFGGISGLEVSAGGASLVAISDAGRYITADIARMAGRITGLTVTGNTRLRDDQGPTPRSFLKNAEGLAIGPDGRAHIAYEGWARIVTYTAPDIQPVWTHKWDRFWDMIGNTGFEALAIDAAGGLLAISEGLTDTGSFASYRYDGSGWVDGPAIPARDGFLVSGADFGPDGALYIVERKFRWYRGFSTRVRRLELDGVRVVLDETLLDRGPGTLDNVEAISVWRAGNGALMLTLVSDDNFNPLQNTYLSEFVLGH